MRATQKFHKGDLVRIADDLGPHMTHFNAGCEAIVLGSLEDQCVDGYGVDEDEDALAPEYEVFIKGVGPVSWYDEDQLSLVQKSQFRLLGEWRAAGKSEFVKGEGA